MLFVFPRCSEVLWVAGHLSDALQLLPARGQIRWEADSLVCLFIPELQSVGRIWLKSRAVVQRDLDSVEQWG